MSEELFYVRISFNNPVFKEINILKVTFSKKNGLKYKTSEFGMDLWFASLPVYDSKFEMVVSLVRCVYQALTPVLIPSRKDQKGRSGSLESPASIMTIFSRYEPHTYLIAVRRE